MDNSIHSQQKPGTLGTFAGVFTPSILTILGIILFLRLGYVVGSAGLMRGLLIIALANAISVLTSFSLAAIATNLRVKGGGDYYLISRTLGLEYGGALGIVLFLAQSVSIAFYCIGFGEAVSGLAGFSSPYGGQIIAAVAVCFLFGLSWVGADLATKFQYVVMVCLTLALLSFYLGGVQHWNSDTLAANWNSPAQDGRFWVLFAIFFPAVTGFTQGVSMSGDLRNPGQSLPLGTFLAVGLSIIVYFSVAVFFAAARPLEVLSSDLRVMGDIAQWQILIDAGVIAATLSSAMASFLGAPRILQSLAQDKIFSFLNPFAKGYGPLNNPRRGVLLSGCIAVSTIALGQLDLIARLVSMFFLISYGLLNYATYFEAQAASPSFRPRFRWYHRNVSLAGFLACLGVMLAIDFTIGVAAIAILVALYYYLKQTETPSRWADGQRSHHLQLVRSNLLEAGADPDHPRDWRPYILAFSDTQERRGRLLRFAGWIEGGSGLTTVVKFVSGEGVRMRKIRQDLASELRKEVRTFRNDTFTRVISGPDANVSLDLLIQSFGIGPVQANTILLNWLEDGGINTKTKVLRYGRYLHRGFRLGCHIVIFSAPSDKWESLQELRSEDRRIDVWWRGDASSRLMLLLAYLTTRDGDWRDAKIRVLATNYPEASEENNLELQESIAESRIAAETLIMENIDASGVVQNCADASLTFLPFSLHEHEPTDLFGSPVASIIHQLPVCAFVLAGQNVDLEAEPEDGEAGNLATILDELERATTRVEKAHKAAATAAAEAKEKMEQIEISGGKLDEELLKKLKIALISRDKADQAEKKHVREQVKLENMSEKAKEAGLQLEADDDRKQNSEPQNP